MPISFPNRASAVGRTHQYAAHIRRRGTPLKAKKNRKSPYILRSAEKKKEWREV